MPRTKQSRGTCAYCSSEMAKSGISKHLKTCKLRQEAIAKAEQGKKAKAQPIYHLRIQSADSSAFWLDLEVNGSSTLSTLDGYLREIWLECCGHMSEFSLDRFGDAIGKQRKIEAVFEDFDQLNHVYDFGTSSETIITVVEMREGKPTTAKAIALMARNNQPEATCMECNNPATYLCMECIYEEEAAGTLCDEHLENHPHDNYGEPLPIVNSPRTGLCGYTGPADPPY